MLRNRVTHTNIKNTCYVHYTRAFTPLLPQPQKGRKRFINTQKKGLPHNRGKPHNAARRPRAAAKTKRYGL